MGRTPCCEKKGLKKGPWTPEEDEILTAYITKHGHGSWRSLPKLAGLVRCGKSCRLRWTNYLRPDIKRGPFTLEEEKLVIQLHGILGNRWAAIASQLAGRTDNEIKNLWNTHLKKRLLSVGLDPKTHHPLTPAFIVSNKTPAPGPGPGPASSLSTRHMAQWESARLEAEARLSRESSLFYPPPPPPAKICDSSSSDYFLRIWNSDVGESFRRFNPKSCCQSPCASASASHSAATPSLNQNEDCKSYTQGGQGFNAHESSFSSSVEFDDDDSSDSTLQLLLDFPINNDMSFLEGNIHPDNAVVSSMMQL